MKVLTMLKKMNSKRSLTIALLLMSGFVFALTILPHAIGEPRIDEMGASGPAENVIKTVTIDRENFSASAYIFAERLDGNGNVIGSVDASVSAYKSDDDIVYYSASAYSSVQGCDENGMPNSARANAWVKVPGNPKMHDQGGRGDTWIDSCCTSYQSAYDSSNQNLFDAGNEGLRAAAALQIQGPRLSVKIVVLGV